MPGPAVLSTLARSVDGGTRVAIATGAGIALGDALLTLMAVPGFSAILVTSALAFEIVKCLGVAYLIYLGICALLEWRGASCPLPQPRHCSRTMGQVWEKIQISKTTAA